MIYLSGVYRENLPFLATPWRGVPLLPEQIWAADTGLFGKSGLRYTNDRYLRWLEPLPSQTCLFAAAPDVVGDAVETLKLAAKMYQAVRGLGFRVALVGQNGLENLAVPWDDFDAFFIGGSTEWKLGPQAAALVEEAKRRGKWVHMGRVNSLRRMQYAESIGCDSADGTVLKHDPHRPVHTWGPSVINQPSLWRPR